MANSTCSVDGCGRSVHTRASGLCSVHYSRMRAHGSTDDPRLAKKRTCSVEGCDRKFYGQDLCNLHWSRKRRSGTTDDPQAVRARRVCSVGGCDRKFFGQGMCQMHYERWKRHGSTDKPVRKPFKHTAETRAKIAASKVGVNNPQYGKTREKSSAVEG